MLTASALVLLATPAFAEDSDGKPRQGEVSGIATWATGVAIGNSNEFAPKYSFVGFNGEAMYHVRDDLSIGVTSGYQVFRGEERETIQIGDGDAALNAYQLRYIDTAPILAVVRYYVAVGEYMSFLPALGVGTVYTNRETNAGLVVFHEDYWHFGVAPQLGLAVHTLGPDPLIDVKYTFAPGGEDSPTESWFTAEVGILFQ